MTPRFKEDAQDCRCQKSEQEIYSSKRTDLQKVSRLLEDSPGHTDVHTPDQGLSQAGSGQLAAEQRRLRDPREAAGRGQGAEPPRLRGRSRTHAS